MKNILKFLLILSFFISTSYAVAISLNKEDRVWLENHKVIKIGIDHGYGPYSYLDEKGEFQGIVKDYLEIIQKRLGIKFDIVKNMSWNELIQAIKDKKIDAIATVTRLPERENFLEFTKLYLRTPLSVMTRVNFEQLKSVDDLKNLSIALVQGYSSSKQIMKKFPNLKYKYVKQPLEGLYALSFGVVDAYVGVIGVNYFLSSQNGITNLNTNFKIELEKMGQHIAIRKDWARLAKILDKILDTINEQEKSAILQKWLPITVSNATNIQEKNKFAKFVPYLIGTFFLLIIGYIIIVLINKKLEVELLKRKKTLDRAQKVAHIGDWEINFKTNKMYLSDESFKIFGKNKEDYINFTTDDFINGVLEENVKTYKQYLNMLINSKSYEKVPVLVTKAKNNSWVEIYGSVEYDKQLLPVCAYGVVLDITQKKVADQELQKKEDLIIAQSRHAAMGEMISMITHQWRQPLSVISMEASNIIADVELDMVDSKTLESTANNIIKQTQELSSTIEDFRNFFKPGKDIEETTLDSVLSDAFGVIEKSIQNNTIKLTKICNSTVFIGTYKRELMQVIINLLKNAKEALLESDVTNREIIVNTEDEKDGELILISDNAGGIDKKIIDKIFEPYFSTKNAKTGTGLGLYMSKTIIEKHLLGTITAYNKSNCAYFEIHLPKTIKRKKNTN